MPSQWFYVIAGKQGGPVTSAELLALVQRGKVVPDTPVRKGSDGKWVSAKRVRGLFPATNATSPSTPTAASEPFQDQPADAIPQKPSQPFVSDVYIVSATPPSEELPQLTSFLKSIAFLQNANAGSRAHATDILRQFGDAFKAEVDSFSGGHSLCEVENLVIELTRVPDVMRSFLGRTPIVKPMEAKALKAIKDMVCGYYRQLRAVITQIEPKSAEMERLLRLVCEAEDAMFPVRHPTSSATPNGEQSQLTAIGSIDAICPYCNQVLEKKPGRKKQCPSCGNFIHVRTRPLDNKKVLVTEAQSEQIEEQWSIVNGTHETYLLVKRRFAEEKARLAKRFGREPSDDDVQWGLLNQELLDNAQQRNWGFFRNTKFAMAEILKKENRLSAALAGYLEVCYIDLNGPNNIGGITDGELLGEYPPWNPQVATAELAPGLVDRLMRVIEKAAMNQTAVEKLYCEKASVLHASLRLPLSPADAWPQIRDALFGEEE